MWVKICGLTTPEAVDATLAAGADAIGFVFAPSPRQVTPAFAAQLAAPARGRAACVAVTRRPAPQLIAGILREFRPDALQTDIEDFPTLALPRELALLPVIREGREPRVKPARFLFEGPESGAGCTRDWSRASKLARTYEIILAGGLNPSNVAAAIAAVSPFGVDVSSGVEDRPGVKSPEKIAHFIGAARAAFRELVL